MFAEFATTDVGILVKGLPSGYELEHLARLFFPGAKVRAGNGTRGSLVYARAGATRLAAGLRRAGGAPLVATAPLPASGTPLKLALSRLVYNLLKQATGLRPPWGLLTGVRPVNLLRKKLADGEEAARHYLVGLCDVSEEKYGLARDIITRQQPALAKTGPRHYSLYVSIPFCPTRCAYCSFVSRTIQHEAGFVEPYLDKLKEELALTARIARENGLSLSTIYIGGGTPTALAAKQLDELLSEVARHFDTGAALEYTVEAGRPDCTDPEKLRLLKQYGVGRISINPQSLDDEVLRRIGRSHTAADFLRCVADARKAGHDNLNMDLIAGLPGDTPQGFAQTVKGVLALAPENVTLHSLTLKRASNLVIDHRGTNASPGAMLKAAQEKLAGAGYSAYYLYRQKSGVENLENTGWALPGKQGLYNIYIMEEVESILAVGAGASTKLIDSSRRRITRLYNHKLPREYIRLFDQVRARKEGVTQFYAGYLDTQTPG